MPGEAAALRATTKSGQAGLGFRPSGDQASRVRRSPVTAKQGHGEAKGRLGRQPAGWGLEQRGPWPGTGTAESELETGTP